MRSSWLFGADRAQLRAHDAPARRASATRSRSSTTSAARRPTSGISPRRRARSSSCRRGLARRGRGRLHLGRVRGGDLRGGRASPAACAGSRRAEFGPRARAAGVLGAAQRERGRAAAPALARRPARVPRAPVLTRTRTGDSPRVVSARDVNAAGPRFTMRWRVADYRFLTDLDDRRVAGGGLVTTIYHPERWPGWWRGVQSVEKLAEGDDDGVGSLVQAPVEERAAVHGRVRDPDDAGRAADADRGRGGGRAHGYGPLALLPRRRDRRHVRVDACARRSRG